MRPSERTPREPRSTFPSRDRCLPSPLVEHKQREGHCRRPAHDLELSRTKRVLHLGTVEEQLTLLLEVVRPKVGHTTRVASEKEVARPTAAMPSCSRALPPAGGFVEGDRARCCDVQRLRFPRQGDRDLVTLCCKLWREPCSLGSQHER